MSKNDGGPAFPHMRRLIERSGNVETFEPIAEGGMTLRDYFAAKAMEGCWANTGPDTEQAHAEITARWAYQMADAMIAEREK